MIRMLRCLALCQLVLFVTFEVKEAVHERAISTFDVEHEEQGQSADDDHPAHEINPSHCSGLGFLGQFRPESYAALATSAFCFSLT